MVFCYESSEGLFQCFPAEKTVILEPSDQHCKFCYLTERESKEPLISPCGCLGSIKYVHKNCLEKWVYWYSYGSQNIIGMSKAEKTYFLRCSLCKKSILLEEDQGKRSFGVSLWLNDIKYYFCVLVISITALIYYVNQSLMENVKKSVKIWKYLPLVVLVVLSKLLISSFELTLIHIEWNSDNLFISLPFLEEKIK